MEHEFANTRKSLERVPEDRFAWKPHPKSWHMGGLATHISHIATWGATVLEGDSFDVMPPGTTEPPHMPDAANRAELIGSFDRNAAALRDKLAGASDEQLMQNWTLLKAGQPVFSMPRVAVLRSMIMNHLIHHRGQLTVYLRLNDIPVPALYGPSADEGTM
jgi:uncharacterized damage-inducible protein DinB